MRLEYAKDPKWVDAEHTLIELTVKWDRFSEELPFAASQHDCEAHGRAVFDAAVKGDFGPIAEYVPPPPPEEETENLLALYDTGPTPPSGDIAVTVFE
jgi:hypothetical protein